MGRKIAVTGIGVINGLRKGANRFNQSIYDCTFDGSFSERTKIEDLIKCAADDVKSDLFTCDLQVTCDLQGTCGRQGKNGFAQTAIIQISDKISLEEIAFEFKESSVQPDLLTAFVKANLLLDRGSVNSVIVISFAGAVVLRDFDLAVAENDRIYAAMEKTVLSYESGGNRETITSEDLSAFLSVFVRLENEDCSENLISEDFSASIPSLAKSDNGEEKEIIIPEGVNCCTICCENLRDLTPKRVAKLSALTAVKEKETVAAGVVFDPMAGFITTLISIYNRYLPGQKNFDISCDITEHTPFYFPFSSRTWFKGKRDQPRKAVLCGTKKKCDYFIFFCEAGLDRPVQSVYLGHSTPLLFPVAASSRDNIGEKLEALSRKAGGSSDLKKLATENFIKYQSAEDKEFVAVVLGVSTSAVKREAGFLSSGLDNSFGYGKNLKTPGGSYFTPRPLDKEGKVVFVYPGVGSAYTGVGQDLFQMFPSVYDFFSKIAPDVGSFVKERDLYPRDGRKLSKDELKLYDKALRKNIMDLSQCGMSFSVIYTMIMAGVFNLFPEYALGYSMGEASMMASLMVWKNPAELSSKLAENDAFASALSGDLTAVRTAWGLSSEKGDEIWESYTLLEDRKKVEDLVNKEDRVYLTLVNTDNELVIAGDPEKCLQVIKKLGCKYFPLRLPLAIHSKPAYLAYDRLVDLYSLQVNKPSGIKLYSSSCYLPVPLRTKAVAHSIAKAFCDTVDFPRLVKKVYGDGGRIFIETGPRQICSAWIDQILAGDSFVTIPLNIKGQGDQVSMARAVAMLMSHGVNVNAEALYKF